jgi:hypothetical protein
VAKRGARARRCAKHMGAAARSAPAVCSRCTQTGRTRPSAPSAPCVARCGPAHPIMCSFLLPLAELAARGAPCPGAAPRGAGRPLTEEEVVRVVLAAQALVQPAKHQSVLQHRPGRGTHQAGGRRRCEGVGQRGVCNACASAGLRIGFTTASGPHFWQWARWVPFRAQASTSHVPPKHRLAGKCTASAKHPPKFRGGGAKGPW